MDSNTTSIYVDTHAHYVVILNMMKYATYSKIKLLWCMSKLGPESSNIFGQSRLLQCQFSSWCICKWRDAYLHENETQQDEDKWENQLAEHNDVGMEGVVEPFHEQSHA